MHPNAAPTALPVAAPTASPVDAPTVHPNAEPTALPTALPTTDDTVTVAVTMEMPTPDPTPAPTPWVQSFSATNDDNEGGDMGDLDVDCNACCDERRRRLRGGRQLLFGQISDAACEECVC